MRHRLLLLSRVAVALTVVMSLILMTSCQTTGGRRWWNPLTWRQETHPPIHPYDVVLPDLPEVAPLPPPGESQTVEQGAPLDYVTIPHPEPIRVEPRELVSEIETIYFAYDSYALSNEMRPRLERNAEWILRHPGITIQIEGHCDERGSVEYNMNLGLRRAEVVREYLALLGVDPNFLQTISYGEERPVDPRSNEEAWAKNRRAQFLIY